MSSPNKEKTRHSSQTASKNVLPTGQQVSFLGELFIRCKCVEWEPGKV